VRWSPTILLALAGVLALPAAAAQAATLSVEGTCFAASEAMRVSGAGWAPGAQVSIGGAAAGSATADAGGRFTVTMSAPFTESLSAKRFTLTASDGGTPATTASVSFPVVKDVFATNAPIDGLPSQTATWRFAGFTPGKAIWAHFRLNGKTVGHYRFGVARGACGLLTVKARRVPIDLAQRKAGRWHMKLDHRRTYSATAPGRLLSFTIEHSRP